MVDQKFKKGDVVRILVGHIIWGFEGGKASREDIDPERIGKLAIINYSYREMYHGAKTKFSDGREEDSYSLIFVETGYALAWLYDSELEFIAEGGERKLLEALSKRKL